MEPRMIKSESQYEEALTEVECQHPCAQFSQSACEYSTTAGDVQDQLARLWGQEALRRLADQDALKIVLRLPDRSPTAGSYHVELESDNGQNRSLKTFAQDGRSVTVVIPAGELKRGQYSLKLFAVGAEQRINGNYFFTVE